MADRPATPTKHDGRKPDSDDTDTFEDAITPRPRQRSPDATRSLTARSLSQASRTTADEPQSPTMATQEEQAPAERDVSPKSTHVNSAIEEQEKRISVGDMDEVNLEEESKTIPPSHSRAATQSSIHTIEQKHTPEDASTPKTSSPIRIIPPASIIPEKVTSPSNFPAMARKFNSPFSFFSRNSTSNDVKAQSPPPTASPNLPSHDRRDTISSINSHADLMLGRYKEDKDPASRRESQDSLKTKFKALRFAAETGHQLPGADPETGPLPGRSASIAHGVAGSALLTPDEERTEAQAGPMFRSASTPGLLRRPTIDPNMAPGTASGMTLGPDDGTPVDWDLWQSVVYEGPAAVARTSAQELSAAISNGIPHAIRGVVWQVLSQSKNEELETIYHELVARGTDKEKPLTNGHASLASISSKDKESLASSASSIRSDKSTPPPTANGAVSPFPVANGDSTHDMTRLHNDLLATKSRDPKDDLAKIKKLEKTIKRDLGSRTSYSKYGNDQTIQTGLFGVCKSYALYDEGVGYAQGMNFIVMPLLLNMSHEEAFCVFVRLMNQYGMREMFVQDMPGLHLHLYQFERLLEDFEPALYCHLHRRGVGPILYATQWFLTLFAYRFPLPLAIRIYDLILSEGLGAILKFALVLMQQNSAALLQMQDMSQLTTFLKERVFDAYIDKQPSQKSILDAGFFGSGGDTEVYQADRLVQDACSLKITPEMLALYRSEWEDKERTRKEREAELETLRAQVTSLTQKVRALEGSAEQRDTEHIEVCNELVRLKMDNERLQDKNESLEGQVQEYKNIADHIKQEEEARWQTDLDQARVRNKEVHESNRVLEIEVDELSSSLATVKMEKAEAQSELETYRQKWKNMKDQFNTD
ncbi:gtpase activating protein [Venturia nashicola]|uniref:GTPase-activating protein GYP5 n=1 Tax=Venturia nashicola TaxID=86259 RepID=A0A4Z1PL96_9PEZI|nr:gtpase activating protein [Venturia nashicola]